ncbi:hypothetical protein [Haladaptatus halobius]|uniref:hypothetical protein n=1 Tax=Haladaptatus halobius TaxID=2884875 RepID=UPI001D0BA66B|nr:hypothetical protein [Haladaptatus halobius]
MEDAVLPLGVFVFVEIVENAFYEVWVNRGIIHVFAVLDYWGFYCIDKLAVYETVVGAELHEAMNYRDVVLVDLYRNIVLLAVSEELVDGIWVEVVDVGDVVFV